MRSYSTVVRPHPPTSPRPQVPQSPQRRQRTGRVGLNQIPKPREIKSYLDSHVIGEDEAKKFSRLRFITTTNG